MRSWVALLTALTGLVAASPGVGREAEPVLLPVEDAFRVGVRLEGEALHVDWVIADGYYLLKDRLAIESPGGGLGRAHFPDGEQKDDPLFGDVEVYRRGITARVPVTASGAARAGWPIRVTSQGCADIGVCYPPHTRTLTVPMPVAATAGFVKVGTQGSQNAIEALRDLNQSVVGATNEEFLPPEVAYILSVHVEEPDTVVVRWEIADGYYLYRDKLGATVIEPAGDSVGPVDMPPGQVKVDDYFGRVNVYYDAVEYRLGIERESTRETELILEIAYQGCADAGLCYPPLKHEVSLLLPAHDAAGAAPASSGTSADTNGSQSAAQQRPQHSGQDPAAHGLVFKRIKGVDGLEAELHRAVALGKPVVLDYYADWCVPCKQMERDTFSDQRVKKALADAVLLQTDVTLNDDADQALLRRFGLYGPPAILFFGPDGAERTAFRVVGFVDAQTFAEHARAAQGG